MFYFIFICFLNLYCPLNNANDFQILPVDTSLTGQKKPIVESDNSYIKNEVYGQNSHHYNQQVEKPSIVQKTELSTDDVSSAFPSSFIGSAFFIFFLSCLFVLLLLFATV